MTTQEREPANNLEAGPGRLPRRRASIASIASVSGTSSQAPASETPASPAAAPPGTPPEVTHNPERDPSDWVTGDEPSTGPQESYIRTLAKEAGEEVPTGLTKAQASETIDRLQAQTGRG